MPAPRAMTLGLEELKIKQELKLMRSLDLYKKVKEVFSLAQN